VVGVWSSIGRYNLDRFWMAIRNPLRCVGSDPGALHRLVARELSFFFLLWWILRHLLSIISCCCAWYPGK